MTGTLRLIRVDPQPTRIEGSGRWRWPLPESAHVAGCRTEVVTASREWWEYAPSGAKPHPFAEGVQLRDGVWYWAVPGQFLGEGGTTDPPPLHEERENDVLCCCGDHLRPTGPALAPGWLRELLKLWRERAYGNRDHGHAAYASGVEGCIKDLVAALGRPEGE